MDKNYRKRICLDFYENKNQGTSYKQNTILTCKSLFFYYKSKYIVLLEYNFHRKSVFMLYYILL